MTWDCHVDDSTNGRYFIFLGRQILTASGFNLEFSYNIIEAFGGHLKGQAATIVYLHTCEFTPLNTGKVTPE